MNLIVQEQAPWSKKELLFVVSQASIEAFWTYDMVRVALAVLAVAFPRT